MMIDVLIVGGSTAGLSAALNLGRFRRDVLVIDSQKPANRFSHASHGFFTRDGVPPHELLAIGREQLRPYETVHIQTGEVVNISANDGHFNFTLADNTRQQTRKVMLATGIKDELPPVEGLAPLWGQSAFHCPYCDGWEQRDQPVAIYANGADAIHLAKLLRVLTADLVICTDGMADFEAHDNAFLRAQGIRVIETPVQRFEGHDGQLEQIMFADGTTLARKAMFIRPMRSQHTDFASQLGFEMTEAGLVKIDAQGRTSVTGVYAAGDMTIGARQLVIAAMQGAMAAMGLNIEMIKEDFG